MALVLVIVAAIIITLIITTRLYIICPFLTSLQSLVFFMIKYFITLKPLHLFPLPGMLFPRSLRNWLLFLISLRSDVTSNSFPLLASPRASVAHYPIRVFNEDKCYEETSHLVTSVVHSLIDSFPLAYCCIPVPRMVSVQILF